MAEKLVVPKSEVTLRTALNVSIHPSRDLVFEFSRPTGELSAPRTLRTVIWVGDDWGPVPFNNLDVERALRDGAPIEVFATGQLALELGKRYRIQFSKGAAARLAAWFDAQRMALGGLASSDFPKHCRRCGRVYTAEAWKRLQLVGKQPSEDEQGRPEVLELRNCKCGSTLAVGVAAPGGLGAFSQRDMPQFVVDSRDLKVLRDTEAADGTQARMAFRQLVVQLLTPRSTNLLPEYYLVLDTPADAQSREYAAWVAEAPLVLHGRDITFFEPLVPEFSDEQSFFVATLKLSKRAQAAFAIWQDQVLERGLGALGRQSLMSKLRRA